MYTCTGIIFCEYADWIKSRFYANWSTNPLLFRKLLIDIGYYALRSDNGNIITLI